MSFPRYPKYKESGVEWLGTVPAHWQVDRIKRSILSAKNGVWGDEPLNDGNDIACIRVADFDRERLRVDAQFPTFRNVPAGDRQGRILEYGDLLLEKSGGGELQPVGFVVLYEDERPAVCSNFIARLRPAPGMHSPFWRYVHAAAYAVRLNYRSIKQTSGIQNLDQQQYLDERCAIPPADEQRAIAAFLDRETAKIDALVAEQRRLMELLKEKRQAIISHAVTKGLDPRAPLKPTGIDWIGDVPAHWEIAGLTKYLYPVVDYRGRTPTKVDDGVFLLTARNISDGKIDYEASQEFIDRDEYEHVMSRGKPARGDVVFTTEAPLGEVANLDREDIAIAQRVIKFRGRPERVNNYYLKYWIIGSACQAQLQMLATGSTALGIKGSKVGQLRLCLPPLVEQAAIVEHLERETRRYEQLVAEAERAVVLLLERRAALISAAVTGQIDVRGVAAGEAA